LHYRGDPLNVTLLYVTRSADSIAFKAELNALDGEHPEMDIQYIHGKNGLTESLIRDFVPVLEEPIFYVSGPEPMVESLGNLLDAMGIPKDHLKQDFFPHYSAKL
jgi:ferredoxin-NADP reductase